MLDMDFVYFDEVEFFKMYDKLAQDTDMDGIFGMSVCAFNTNRPYDTGAIRHHGKILEILWEKELVHVSSAFSGFGIYRTSSIRRKNASYRNQHGEIEHITFNRHFDKLYVYPSFRPVYESSIDYSCSILRFGTFRTFTISLMTLVIVILVGIVLLCILLQRHRRTGLLTSKRS